MTISINYLQKNYEKLKKIIHVENSSPVFNTDNSQLFKVNIRPDISISKGMFKPDSFIQGAYKAHPVTISALKKDIFTGGDDTIDLEDIHICLSCGKEIDLQFWHFCPYCESSFPNENRT